MWTNCQLVGESVEHENVVTVRALDPTSADRSPNCRPWHSAVRRSADQCDHTAAVLARTSNSGRSGLTDEQTIAGTANVLFAGGSGTDGSDLKDQRVFCKL